MSYITIEIDKKFLAVIVLLLIFVGSVVGSYRIGFNRGATAAMEYIMEALQGSKRNLDNNAS